jgi:hypothetical protein
MRASKEAKRLIATMRRKHGKRNGVIDICHFDKAIFIWRHYDRKRRILARERQQYEVLA